MRRRGATGGGDALRWRPSDEAGGRAGAATGAVGGVFVDPRSHEQQHATCALAAVLPRPLPRGTSVAAATGGSHTLVPTTSLYDDERVTLRERASGDSLQKSRPVNVNTACRISSNKR